VIQQRPPKRWHACLQQRQQQRQDQRLPAWQLDTRNNTKTLNELTNLKRIKHAFELRFESCGCRPCLQHLASLRLHADAAELAAGDYRCAVLMLGVDVYLLLLLGRDASS
jgi:hypothetical protein